MTPASPDQATLKVLMPQDRYIALIHLAAVNDRSVNSRINNLVSAAISELCTDIKQVHRGQGGDSEGEG